MTPRNRWVILTGLVMVAAIAGRAEARPADDLASPAVVDAVSKEIEAHAEALEVYTPRLSPQELQANLVEFVRTSTRLRRRLAAGTPKIDLPLLPSESLEPLRGAINRASGLDASAKLPDPVPGAVPEPVIVDVLKDAAALKAIGEEIQARAEVLGEFQPALAPEVIQAQLVEFVKRSPILRKRLAARDPKIDLPPLTLANLEPLRVAINLAAKLKDETKLAEGGVAPPAPLPPSGLLNKQTIAAIRKHLQEIDAMLRKRAADGSRAGLNAEQRREELIAYITGEKNKSFFTFLKDELNLASSSLTPTETLLLETVIDLIVAAPGPRGRLTAQQFQSIVSFGGEIATDFGVPFAAPVTSILSSPGFLSLITRFRPFGLFRPRGREYIMPDGTESLSGSRYHVVPSQGSRSGYIED